MNKLLLASSVLIVAIAALFYVYTNKSIGGGEIVYTVDSDDHVLFSHKFHVEEKGLVCIECHSSIFTMDRKNFEAYKDAGAEIMSVMEKGKLCGECHNNSSAFTVRDNCSLCHSGL